MVDEIARAIDIRIVGSLSYLGTQRKRIYRTAKNVTKKVMQSPSAPDERTCLRNGKCVLSRSLQNSDSHRLNATID